MIKFLNKLRTIAVMLLCFMVAIPAFAQNSGSVTVVLQDESDGSAIGFATVSITKKGASKALKYALTDQNGKAVIEKLAAGTYTVKAEMMGYIEYTKEVTVADKAVNLGTFKMKTDQKVLDAASVSAVGDPIVVKKDTIEYNASSFRITESDMLEDLLKKFPGIEVGSDGSITANGQTISKIYVDGKTYFMDDPTLATKNLPAKIIEKVKVINKKSDQAEFTGIDDGQEETVLDLSVQKGMMNGIMGNLRGGIGHDWPTDDAGYDDYRYNSNLFLGNFSSGAQYSVIGNINNANNMSFGGFGGEMMRGMGGGGTSGNGGVTTSYMIGANAGYDLFDGKMDFSGNYNLNGAKNDSRSSQYQENNYDTYQQIQNTNTISNSNSLSHNIGMRINHTFSKSSSLIFEPSISFGTGSSNSIQDFDTQQDDFDSVGQYNVNDGFSYTSSDRKQISASGRLQYRQRLGIPGRTLVINGDFSFGKTNSDGLTQSLTNYYQKGTDIFTPTIINQRTDNDSRNSSVTMRATYTEPMGHNFYIEGNYSVGWNKSNQKKEVYDGDYDINSWNRENHSYNKSLGESISVANSNNIVNDNLQQTVGADLLYQGEKLIMQAGVSLIPTRIHNTTEKYLASGNTYKQIDTTYSIVNWSPQAMIRWELSDRFNMRFNYRGSSSQPSVSQLVPVFDNSNPISQSLGNPYLNPYFSHNINADIRYSNPRTYASFNARIGGGFTQNPLVNASWTYNGKSFSMPVNGPTSNNFSLNFFGNLPIARSNFSVSNDSGLRTNKSSSYQGTNVDLDGILSDSDFDYGAFRSRYGNLKDSKAFTQSDVNSLNLSERLTFTFRTDALEIRVGGGTTYSHSHSTISSMTDVNTFNNNINGSFTWSWNLTGLSFKSDMNYKWYNGYKTEMPSEKILNGEISKLIFNGRATIAANIYDLLGETRNFTSSYSGNNYSESTNNTVGRYVMLSFTWRFGTIGGRSGRGSRSRGGMMGGGMMGGGMPGGMSGGMGGFGGGRGPGF